MVRLSNESIPGDIYRELRILSGLSPKEAAAAEIGLKNTLHSVLVKDEQHDCIGMGRVIGDGGCFCQVVDICVLPGWQGQGIGKMIMQNIMEYIQKELPESCYISLIADGEASKLYEQYGFQDTLPKSKGMFFRK